MLCWQLHYVSSLMPHVNSMATCFCRLHRHVHNNDGVQCCCVGWYNGTFVIVFFVIKSCFSSFSQQLSVSAVSQCISHYIPRQLTRHIVFRNGNQNIAAYYCLVFRKQKISHFCHLICFGLQFTKLLFIWDLRVQANTEVGYCCNILHDRK